MPFRLIIGLGFGCVYISTNLYVAECAPTKLRGSFVGTVSQFGYQLGTLIAFWSGYGIVLPQVALQHRLARLQYNGGPDHAAAGESEGTSDQREAMAITDEG